MNTHTHTKESRELRKLRLSERNERLKQRMNELYNEHRLRYDDVINKLCEEFFLAPITVQRIIKA